MSPEEAGKTAPRPRGSLRLNVRGWIFLALALSVAFAACIKGNNLLFAVFSILFSLFAVSGLMTVLVARGIEVSRILPETVSAGEIFSVGLRIRNSKRLLPAFCLRFEDRLACRDRPAPLQTPPVWLPVARPGQRARGSYFATAGRRGPARLGPFTMVSEFTPGLFTYRAVLPVEDPILVLPRPGLLNRRLLGARPAQVEYSDAAPTACFRGSEEFAGLREYRPGDSLHRIHWKMSARLQETLLVREFEDAQVRDATVLLETCLPDPKDRRRRMRLERAITFAATLAEALLNENYRVRFFAFAPELVTLRLEPRRGAIEELLRALAVLEPPRTPTLAALLAAGEDGPCGARFLLRIGSGPLAVRHMTVVNPADMRRLLHVP